MRKTKTTKTSETSNSNQTVPDFVVYITFPDDPKNREYVYKCNLPNIGVGSFVVANGTLVRVHRFASFDSRATRYVQSQVQQDVIRRKVDIANRLRSIQQEEQQLELWSKLKSPEAKRLVKELKELSK